MKPMSMNVEQIQESPEHTKRVWVLPEGRRDELEACRDRLGEVRDELTGFSKLLRSVQDADVVGEDGLYGVGISLQRILKRIERVEEKLSQVVSFPKQFRDD